MSEFTRSFIIENLTSGDITFVSVEHYNEHTKLSTAYDKSISRGQVSGSHKVKTNTNGEDYWMVSFIDGKNNLFFSKKLEWGMKKEDGYNRPFNVQLFDSFFRIVGKSHSSSDQKYYQVEEWEIDA